jgi:hypothetical protein
MPQVVSIWERPAETTSLSRKDNTMNSLSLRNAFLLAILGLPPAAAAEPDAKTDLPAAQPEEVGMSSERLSRINAALQRHIDAHQLAGAVTLIARKGKVVHFQTHGWADLESKRPMREIVIPETGTEDLVLTVK